MKIGNVEQAELYGGGNIRSTDVGALKVLLEGREGSLNNFRLFHGETGPEVKTGFEAPRHRHNFEQFRLPIKGGFEHAPGEMLKEGCVGYFPEGVYYGPQTRHPGLELLTLQFGGPSRSGYLSSTQRKQGFDKLKDRGTFQEGFYTWLDGAGQRHNQDAFEAVWEAQMGRKLVYPKPRYDDLVFMDPAAYEWTPDRKIQGIFWKHMAAFTENGTAAGFVLLEPGATLPLRSEDSIDIYYLLSGSVSCGGQSYGPRHAFARDPSEAGADIQAVGGARLFFARLPIVTPESNIARPSAALLADIGG